LDDICLAVAIISVISVGLQASTLFRYVSM